MKRNKREAIAWIILSPLLVIIAITFVLSAAAFVGFAYTEYGVLGALVTVLLPVFVYAIAWALDELFP